MVKTRFVWFSISHPLETQGHIPENDNELLQYTFICNSNNDYYNIIFLNFLTILILFILTVLLDVYIVTATSIFFFVEYLPKNDRKRPNHVGRLPHVVYHRI
jgi:hypothetical protein